MSERAVTVSVLQGSIHVNQLWLERSTEHVFVFQGNLREKRAEVAPYGGSSEFLSVVLYPEGQEEDEKPTEIRFSGDFSGNWQVLAEVVRYTLTMILFQPNPEASVCWQDDDREEPQP